MEYKKFEFRDLRGGAVVSAPRKNESEAKMDEIVHEAVSSALADNIVLPKDSVVSFDGENLDNASGSSNEDMKSIEDIKSEQDTIDVEHIRSESYQHGYDDAKAHFEPLLKEIKEDESLVSNLRMKLDSLIPKTNIQEQLCSLTTGIIGALAKKMHITLPVDFDGIILGEMMSILNKYYKNGEITIKIHPERVDYCENLLKIKSLPSNVSGNVKLLADETLGKGDCSLSWGETELKYSQDDILQDINKMLEHLKDAAKQG